MTNELCGEAEPSTPSEIISVWPNEIELVDINRIATRLKEPGESLYLYDADNLQGPISGASIRINNDNGLFRAYGEVRLARGSDPSNLQRAFMEKTQVVDTLDTSANYPSHADASITARPLSNSLTIYSHVSSLESFVAFQIPQDPAEKVRVRIATDYSTQGKEYVSPPRIEDVDLPNTIRDFLKLWLSTVNTLITCDDPLAIPKKLDTFRLEMSQQIEKTPISPGLAKLALRKAGHSAISYKRMQEALGRMREQPQDVELQQPSIELSDIGGMFNAIQQAQEVIKSFTTNEANEKWGVPRQQGVLLHGPSGTGKTMLANAIAHQLHADVSQISPADIPEKHLGESEANVKRIIGNIRNVTKTTVLLIENIEDIVMQLDSARSGAEHVQRAVATILKQEMDKLVVSNPNVLIIATTNNIDSVDPDLISPTRFQSKIPLSYPNVAERSDIWSVKIAHLTSKYDTEQFNMFDPSLNMAELGKHSEGMSGADIELCLVRIRQLKASEENIGHESGPITQQDIKSAIFGYYR